MTFCATSADGVHFSAMVWRPKIPAKPPLSKLVANLPKQYLGRFYFKTFTLRGQIYALARNNRLGAIIYRKPGSAIHGEPVGPWVRRPGGLLRRMRHAAVSVSRDEKTLHIFYSRVGDMPEGIYLVNYNVANKDWTKWSRIGEPRPIMTPKYRWEGATAVAMPTTYGAKSHLCAASPAADIRDPCLLETQSGRVYLFYAGGGEGGIGVTEIAMPCSNTLGAPKGTPGGKGGRLAGNGRGGASARKGKRGKKQPKAVRSVAGTARRVVLYDAGCIGLGHTRRCARLATALVKRSSPAHPTDVLIITGTDSIHSFIGNVEGIDYVHLPGYKRDRTLPAAGPWNQYRSRSIKNPIPSCANSGVGLQSMRAQLIKAALLSFRPDAIIVDFEPVGVFSELVIGITAARAANPKIKVILGVRDVLDDPDQIRAEWNAKGVFPFLHECYDGVLVYGIESIHNPLAALLPSATPLDVHFVGYLGGDDDDETPAGCGAIERRSTAFAKFCAKHHDTDVFHIGEFVIVSGGGGSDAGDVYDWVLRACEDHGGDGSSMPRFVFIFGPYCPERLVVHFTARIALLRQRGLRAVGFSFVDPLIMEALLAYVRMLPPLPYGLCSPADEEALRMNWTQHPCQHDKRILRLPARSWSRSRLFSLLLTLLYRHYRYHVPTPPSPQQRRWNRRHVRREHVHRDPQVRSACHRRAARVVSAGATHSRAGLRSARCGGDATHDERPGLDDRIALHGIRAAGAPEPEAPFGVA